MPEPINAVAAIRKVLTLRSSIPIRLEIAGLLASQAAQGAWARITGSAAKRDPERMFDAFQRRIYSTKWMSGRLYLSIDDILQGLHNPSREDHLDYNTLIEPGETACDVGAHIGTHTIRMFNAIGSTGQVIAIEPDRRNFGLLCLNLHGNDVPEQSTVLLRGALGPEDGSCRLYRKRHSMCFSTVRESDDFVTVDAISFQTLLGHARDGRIDFMKMDIEGAEERLILSETQAFAEKRIGRLYTDLHGGVDYDAIAAHLDRFGYQRSVLKKGHLFTA